MGHHVFISYSRDDQTYARRLGDDLRANGFEPWNDEDIEHGARWWPTIVEAIQDCTAFVVVMTTESDVSEWVLKEIMLADRDEKLILPLLLSGKGHAYLIDRQHEDVTDGQMPPEAFYDQLRRLLSNRTEDELRSDVLHFTIHYDPKKIKRGGTSTIKLKFTNTFPFTIVLKSYQFFGYREGQPITNYNIHPWDNEDNKKIPPGKEAFQEWGPADPLKEWFWGEEAHGVYETRIEIIYVVLDGEESERTAVEAARLIVSAGR